MLLQLEHCLCLKLVHY
uniref:Uncharacterized protein n=1 Tax=Anguilla anguilla TaxID=7936 RepID=A0A0E9XNL2_ANGAN